MTTRAQKIRLGIFMLLAMFLTLATIVTLAGLKLWNPRDNYFVKFKQSVSGLEVGATVRMKGVRVGQVDKIAISEDIENVIVTLSLEPGTPVKTDTKAVMTSIGIAGLYFVELTGGSLRAPLVKPNESNSVIAEGESALQSLTGKATDIALKMEKVLNNVILITGNENQTKLSTLLTDMDRLASSWAKIGEENEKRIKRIAANLENATHAAETAMKSFAEIATENKQKIAQTLDATENAANALKAVVQNLRPQQMISDISKAADAVRTRVEDPAITKMIVSLNVASNHLATASKDLTKLLEHRNHQLGNIFTSLEDAALDLKRFARAIREKPSLLIRGETRKDTPIQ